MFLESPPRGARDKLGSVTTVRGNNNGTYLCNVDNMHGFTSRMLFHSVPKIPLIKSNAVLKAQALKTIPSFLLPSVLV